MNTQLGAEGLAAPGVKEGGGPISPGNELWLSSPVITGVQTSDPNGPTVAVTKD